MKKFLIIVLSITCLLLTGCSASEEPTPDPTSGPETLNVERVVIAPFGRGAFIDDDTERPEPVKELPEGYGHIKDLSEDEAVDSGLGGCGLYADLTLDPSECEDVYLYQPVGESGEEWAYVRYVRLVYGEV